MYQSDITEKLLLLRQLQQREEERRTLGVATYSPHKKQDLFHRHGKFRYRYLRTGNRFGKTECGSAEDMAHALGYRPWYPEGDPARYEGIPQRPTKGLILCTDWPKSREVFTCEDQGEGQGALWKWLPADAFVKKGTNHSGDINRLTVKSIWGGESSIYIDVVAGFKINEQRGESGRFDWIHVDEPIPRKMWTAYSRGLIDRNGKAWFTCTPILYPWINRFFVPSLRMKLDENGPNYFDDDKVVVVGDSSDNPFVSEEGMAAYFKTLDPRELAARKRGLPIESTGLIHPDFDFNTHIYTEPPTPEWPDINTPPKSYTIRYHIDFHTQVPIAVIFSATAPNGRVFFFDEIFEKVDALTLAEMIRTKLEGYFVAHELIDPSSYIPQGPTKESFADELLQYGLVCEKAIKDLNRGIHMTNVALRKPGYLNFANNLHETKFEFDSYVFDDPEKRPNKPKDKNDHMMEGLHRLVMNGLDFIDQQIFDGEYHDVPNPLLMP